MNTQELPVVLTDDEYMIRSKELAEKVQELAQIESEKKAANNTFKERIESAEIQVVQLARIVKERKEWREVEVKDVRNMERMTMDTIRLDTGEVVSYRDLKGHERNLGLFDGEEQADPEKSVQ